MKSFEEIVRSNSVMYKRYKESYKDHSSKLLSHPDVQQLMEAHCLSEEHIKQMLADIRHWLLEKENCKSCTGIDNCLNMYKGHAPQPLVDAGHLFFEYKTCPYQISAFMEQRHQRLLKSHIHASDLFKVTFADLGIDKDNTEIIKRAFLYCQRFNELRGKGIYLYGNFGVGKTYLMGAMARELVDQGFTVYFVHVPTFFREMKQAISDQSLWEKMREIEKVDCLILDDIGAENLSPWLRDEVLGPLLQYRTQNNKPILYTSNFSYDQLQEHLAETGRGEIDLMKSLRIMERIRSYTDAYFIQGKNRRRV